MSRSYSARYELERRARAELEKKRAAEFAENLYSRYQSQLETMTRKGYEAYIPDELGRLSFDLDSVRTMLAADRAIEARDLTRHIGAYIGSIDVIANAAIARYERTERMRSEQERVRKMRRGSSLMDVYYELVGAIDDPVVINLALPDLERIQHEIEGGMASEASIRQSIASVISKAEADSEQFKREEEERRRKACLSSQLEDAAALIEGKRFASKETTEGFADRIAALKRMLATGDIQDGSLGEEIGQLGQQIEDAVIEEEVRREAVKAIYQQLRSQEFTVEAPRRFVTEGSDYVRIVARRPSGRRVVCEVDSHGALKYRFDKYEGMTCLKDIEIFNVDLERVYSLKLSEERVLWSNPDRLAKDAYDAASEDRRTL
ncbi:hypothetical protein DMP06_00090 [Slackia equolifaciens]|uniref:Uncharacterized protein n=1 Tax=Slackia equolifaciens TaxID=498718 RepID=A0A3N0B405_9ACTN|nr:hypothetical protein [Slackia equolifaciens]RNL41855.1 hypothetical protein DMP06_00090 [Slackia equolifaciens]